jgi:hypothetical protein
MCPHRRAVFMKADRDLHYLLSHTISIISSVLKVRTLQTRVARVTLVRPRLETLHWNGVPALCPMFSGLQTGFCSLSPVCQISLDVLGGHHLSSGFHLRKYYRYALGSAPILPCGTPNTLKRSMYSCPILWEALQRGIERSAHCHSFRPSKKSAACNPS